jgi:drug/metabolite transporter (DMT)-like permease
VRIAIESLKDRAIEWYSACVMVAWGVTFALPGNLLSKPDFVGFHRYTTSDALLACVFSFMGSAGLIALYINGRWPRGPLIRIARGAFGAVAWALIAYAFYDAAQINNLPIGTGPLVYALLALFEFVSIYRAAYDVRYHHA